jgi:hypothetical protein
VVHGTRMFFQVAVSAATATGNVAFQCSPGSKYSLDVTPYDNMEGLAQGNPAPGTVTISRGGSQLVVIPLDSEGVASYPWRIRASGRCSWESSPHPSKSQRPCRLRSRKEGSNS